MFKQETDLTQVKISTDRLLLVPISMKYREECYKEFDEEITEFMNPMPPKEIGDTEKFISDTMQAMEHGSELVCAILKKDTLEFLGCAGLHEIATPVPELGVWIKKSAHGSKYGREAMTALKAWADERLDYDYLIYPVARDNISSRKIPESLGGKVAREYMHTTLSGKVLPFVNYHIFNI